MGITSVIRGLLTPFRRDATDLANTSDVGELVKSRICQILGTKTGPTAGQGTLPWRPEFGTRLWTLRHTADPQVLNEVARAFVVDSLRRWEPSVLVRDVTVTNENDGILRILVVYDVVGRVNNVAGPVFSDQLVLEA